MSVNLTVNGQTFAYPTNGEESGTWGENATNWATAVSNGTLQKSGGTFTLTNDVDFGASNGIKTLYYKTRSNNIAGAGEFRLARTDVISWRNEANSANLDLGPGTDDALEYNGIDIVDVSSTQSLSNKSFSDDLGVGTSSPERRLHVNSGSSDVIAKFESTDTKGVIYIVDNNTVNQDTLTRIGDDLTLLSQGGNVGIGEESPASTLHIKNSSSGNSPTSGAKLTVESNDGSSYIQMLGNSTQVQGLLFGGANAFQSSVVYDHGDGVLALRTGNNNDVFLINDSGEAGFKGSELVGIGPQFPDVRTPDAPLHIRTSGDNLKLRLQKDGGNFSSFDFRIDEGNNELLIDSNRAGGNLSYVIKPTSGGTSFEHTRFNRNGDLEVLSGDVLLAQDPTSDLHAATKQYVDDKHPGTLEVVKFTSKIDNPTFQLGWEGWGASLNTDGRVYIRKSTQTSGAWFEQHALKLAQVPVDTASANSKLDCLQHFAVDKDKALVIGGGGYYSGGATGNFDVIVRWFDQSNIVDSTDTVSVSVPQDVSLDGQNGEYIAFFEADGGLNQPIPSDAVGADVSIENVDSSGTSYWIFQLYAIPEESFPYPRDFSGPVGTSQSNAGTGTHEALTVGSNCYVLAHPYDMVAKYDTDLVRTDEVSVNQRPHDITVDTSSGNLWIVTNEVGNGFAEEIDPSTMTVLNSYQLDSMRAGFGITYYSGTLYAGIGAASSETPAIVSINPSTGSQSVLTTDVNGGDANIPVKVTDGSLWSINSADSSTSEVKRYTLSGTTEATITAGIGKIYGLDTNNGADSSFVWAHGEKGVVKIDPSTDSVVQTYIFKLAYGGGTNVKKIGNYIYGGSRNSVAWTINTDTDEIIEKQMPLGTIKWVEEFNGNTLIGWSYAPYLMLVK